MGTATAYRILCGLIGALLLLAGVALVVGFFRYHMPASAGAPMPVGPWGAYFMAFTGSALCAWGGCLVGAARRPQDAPWIATATSFGLVLAAVYRIFAWVMGDYAEVGNLLRVEAAIMLLLALAFLWLRPARGVTATA
jgi:hypothetical protein